MHVDLPSQMTFRVDLVNKLDLQILKVSKSNLLKALVSVWRFESFFSRMRSKGSRFTLAVWGLRVCSLDAAFMSATVRNRSQSQPFPFGPHGRAYRKFCQRGHFWMFPALRGCVSCGRRGFS